ncbi:MAG: hypothetical protein U0412_05760 [Nitrospira sp.]
MQSNVITRLRTLAPSLSRAALLLSLHLLMAGCAGVRVEYFSEDTFAPRQTADQIEWLTDEPERPHLELARIVVRSANLSAESLRTTLVERARSLGADAVIGEVPITLVSNVGSPYYEPGLISPSGAAFGLYGYGWYTPYSSNPYLLTQGAADQPRTDLVLSAIAIRYR